MQSRQDAKYTQRIVIIRNMSFPYVYIIPLLNKEYRLYLYCYLLLLKRIQTMHVTDHRVYFCFEIFYSFLFLCVLGGFA